MVTKLVDSKGRVSLGINLAGKMVLIDDSNADRIIITPAVAIPAREAWLYQNEEALGLVREGLAQAQAGQFAAEVPNLENDAKLADALDR